MLAPENFAGEDNEAKAVGDEPVPAPAPRGDLIPAPEAGDK